MRILFLGDIVARPGREVVSKLLPQIRSEHKPDITIANAENLAHGRGVTERTLTEMLDSGIDHFTSGDHVFWHMDSEEVMETMPIVRPANYPAGTPGVGHRVIDLGSKGNLLLINVMGRTFLNERLDDPFRAVDHILAAHKDKNIMATLVDFHAEATSEKYAMSFYLDGRVDALLGTHTHVPTCDHWVLPGGTAFVADVGMCGIVDSVLGVKSDIIIDLYLSARNKRFEWESTGKSALRSVIIDTAQKSIERVDLYD